jgi:hypothetical protein
VRRCVVRETKKRCLREAVRHVTEVSIENQALAKARSQDAVNSKCAYEMLRAM